MKLSLRLFVLVALTALACSGAGTGGGGYAPEPKPKPAPKPAPDPANNARDCASFFGVSLPDSGGTITKCSKNKVTIWHSDSASEAKWTYADRYVKKGWSRGAPEKGSPTVSQGAKTLVMSSSGDNVEISKR